MGFTQKKLMILKFGYLLKINMRNFILFFLLYFSVFRMKTRYKNQNETYYAGTLNGSGLAIGRTLIAILENYQQKDGSITIPKVLRSYMDDLEKISQLKLF